MSDTISNLDDNHCSVAHPRECTRSRSDWRHLLIMEQPLPWPSTAQKYTVSFPPSDSVGRPAQHLAALSGMIPWARSFAYPC